VTPSEPPRLAVEAVPPVLALVTLLAPLPGPQANALAPDARRDRASPARDRGALHGRAGRAGGGAENSRGGYCDDRWREQRSRPDVLGTQQALLRRTGNRE
jgi:hypothetical protein